MNKIKVGNNFIMGMVMNKFEETEYLGEVGDRYYSEQQQDKARFFELLKSEYGITEDKFYKLSCESQVHYLEKIDISK